jgi:uncharacterized membrane protein YfcA
MLFEFSLIFVCLGLGGLLKGATGAGTPLLAVPALAAVIDVPFAIVILIVPNLVTNVWQVWEYREHSPGRALLVPLVGGGMAGVIAGTWLLAVATSDALLAVLGIIVLGYIGLKVAKPNFKLSDRAARVLYLPAGLASGFLQGAIGLSAPISITFMNALGMARPRFIFTISLLFGLFILIQIPALAIGGFLTLERLALSTLALIPVTLAMPLGAYLAARMPPGVFDKLILILLGALAIKLLLDAAF